MDYGSRGCRGVRSTLFRRGWLWLLIQPQVRLSRTQQSSVGADGVPRIHRDGDTMVDVRLCTADSPTRAIHHLPDALLPALVHLPAAHTW